MGILDLLCITTDPNATSFYGFPHSPSYGTPESLWSFYNVLIKSNINSANSDSIIWSRLHDF